MSLRLKAWIEKTHGPVFELHRHYARQLFQSDAISSPDDLRRVVITGLAAIASIGFLVPKLYYQKYEYLSLGPDTDLYRRAIYADQLFFLVMTILGIAALVVFRWDSLFPSRQDYLILRPMPLKLSQVYFAKLTTLSGFAMLTVMLLAVPCAFSFASVISGGHDLAPSWQEMAAQVIVAFCAGAFTVFTLSLFQSVLMNLLPLRWYARVSVSVQSLLLVTVLCVIPWAVDLPNWFRSIDLRPAWSVYAPPLWFLCLYERLLGRANAFDAKLAQRGVWATIFVVVATIVVSAVFHRRYARRIFESAVQANRSRMSLLERLVERFVGDVRESAILQFALRSLDRMQQHRMVRLLYAGAGCALVLESGIGLLLAGAMSRGKVNHGAALDAVFALPLLLFFFLFSGLRYAFRIPVDVRANWIFRLTVPDAFTERARALRILYFGLTIVPAAAATSPFLVVVLGTWRAIYAVAFAVIVALWLVEYEIQESDTVPLTCSYLPGKKNILHTGLIYWIVVFLLTSVVTALEVLGGRNPVRAVLVLMMLALIDWRMRTREQILMSELRFDDLPEPAVATLGLARE